jgi:putative membrane protein
LLFEGIGLDFVALFRRSVHMGLLFEQETFYFGAHALCAFGYFVAALFFEGIIAFKEDAISDSESLSMFSSQQKILLTLKSAPFGLFEY